MATIAELKNAVNAAEKYLDDVRANQNYYSTYNGFTGAATVREIFRIQTEKDKAQGEINLQKAKDALAQAELDAANQSRDTFQNAANQSRDTFQNTSTPSVSKIDNKQILLFLGLIGAAIIILRH